MKYFNRILLGICTIGCMSISAGAADVEDGDIDVTFTTRYFDVEGDASLFREHYWRRDDLTGGVDSFRLNRRLSDRVRLDVDGRAIFDESDLKLHLRLEDESAFFIDAGFDKFRKYFDDTGGFYDAPGPAQTFFQLDEDLFLDIGKVWFDLGVQRDESSKLVIGYEYRFKDGEKSLLEWNRPGNRQIFPAVKAIDEETHTFKVDLTENIGNLNVENKFRYDIYDSDTECSDVIPAGVEGRTAPDGRIVDEDFEHDQITNTLTIDRWVEEWLYVSGGYMFVKLNGEADYAMTTIPGTGSRDKFWVSDRILLDQRSNVLNFNTFVIPAEKVNISLGFQAEQTDTDGFTNADLVEGAARTSEPVTVDTEVKRRVTQENIELRYSGIPFTIVYAKADFVQEKSDHFENELELLTGDDAILRDTNGDNDHNTYRVGVTTSPVSRLSLSSFFERAQRNNDYDHRIDIVTSGVYPAFIRSQDIDSDEFTVNLAWRPVNWLKTSLKYQYMDTDYQSVTDLEPGGSGGGSVASGAYEADIYSVNATVTPDPRFYVSAGFYLQNNFSTSPGISAGAVIADYEGDVYSISTSMRYLWTDATNVDLSYYFSHADNAQDNIGGLPLGVGFERHNVLVGVAHQFSARLTGNLKYSFLKYRDTQYNGAEDYDANALVADIRVTF